MVSLSFLGFAATAGALSLLTPCVFPMVPITVSYFTQHGDRDRQTTLRNALVFAAGIIATFTALGFAVALLVGATGVSQFAANPWVNLLIATLFVVFALDLLGYYEIAVPFGVVNRLDAFTRGHASSGAVGAFLLGLTFTLTSFTCTAPFIGTLLVSASQGQWQQPLVGMLAYSTVFALPFVLLAVIPRAVRHLPRSGNWLNSVKVVMGLVEMAATFKFLSNADLVWGWHIFTHTTVLTAWVIISGIIVAYLLGAVRFPHDIKPDRANDRGSRRVQIGPGRAMAVAAFTILTLWLGSGIRGHSLGEVESFLPPKPDQALSWIRDDYARSLALAKENHRRVFINFTGVTCINCRLMEATIFTRPEVKRALAQFELAELYTDLDGQKYEAQQAFQQRQFGTVALPLYAVVDANGKTVATFAGLTRDPRVFVRFLEEAAE